METSWECLEGADRITIVHDNRWLAIIGVPMALFGLLLGVGLWFIEDARTSGAWPILVVGSLIGMGIAVFGLALCFKYDEISADRRAGELIRHTGLSPFRRTRTWPLSDVEEVVCLDERMAGSSGRSSSLHHRLRLVGPGISVLVASALEPEPVEYEALRWSEFLDLPLRDTIGADLTSQLRDSRAGGRTSSE
ncbi:MAG: hypothetical protein ACR2RV_27525 [Verrucomicrobiales bacterium]